MARFLIILLASWTAALAQSGGNSSGSVGLNYVIQPSDILHFRIFQEPDMEAQVRVEADGSVRLPLVGMVRLGSMTVSDAQQYLFKRYDADYFVNPQLSLQVIEYAARNVNVLGQVHRPGVVLIPPDRPLFLSDAIAQAGGTTRLANLSRIQLKRVLESGEIITRELNLDEIISNPNTSDFPLIDGDTLHVVERRF
ncbi:MAG: polysaccharide biosynthesis/export family protein [Opitutales bacterium]